MNTVTVVDEFSSQCRSQGLDLVHGFGARPLLPALGRLGVAVPDAENPAAALVANTRSMWPAFRAALCRDPALLRGAHPLDTWVERTVERAAAATGASPVVLWAHRPLANGAYVPLQRLAVAAGFAVLAPCHLLVHPKHGPWLGLRALVLFSREYPSVARSAAGGMCDGCPAPCMPALRAAEAGMCRLEPGQRVTGQWRAWLAVRDACPAGAESRYSDEQIRYHYQRDRTVLDASE